MPPTSVPRRVKTGSIMVLVALLATGLAVAGDVTGQSTPPGGGGYRGPQEERLAAGVQNEKVLFEDQTGDAEILFSGAGEGVDNPYAQAGDILSLKAGETTTHLLFSIYHKAYDATASKVSEYTIGHEHYCDLDFTVGASGNKTLSLGIYGDNFLDGGDFRYSADARLRVAEEGEGYSYTSYEYLGGIPAALVAGDHLEVLLDKRYLSGTEGKGEAPPAGTALTAFALSCDRRIAFFGYYDTLENANVAEDEYVLGASSANQYISLGLEGASMFQTASGDVFEALAAEPGKGRKATLVVENMGDRKLLVNLTTRVVDDAGAPVEGWKITLAPTVEVRSRNVTHASLIVVPPADAKHRDGAWLHIEGRPLGREGVVSRTLRVVANAALGPDANILYFHVVRPGENCVSCGTGAFFANYGTLFALNPLQSDPGYTDAKTTGGEIPVWSSSDMGGGLDMPLVRPIRLDPEGKVDVVLSFATEMAREVEVNLRMYADGDVYLGGMTQSIDVGASLAEYRFPIRPREEALLVSGSLWLEARFRESGPTGGLMYSTWIDHVDWDPAGSRIELPLLAYVEPEFQVTDGRALPTLHILSKTDTEQYVNPGKNKVFDLQLVNEGTQQDDLEVVVTPSDARWTATLRPCCRYRLEPGATAPFSVILSAPADARDGEVVYVNLTATSRNDKDVRTSVSLRAIVTEQVPLADEEYIPPEEGEYVAPLREKRDSPAAPFLLVVLAAFAIVAAVRRRR